MTLPEMIRLYYGTPPANARGINAGANWKCEKMLCVLWMGTNHLYSPLYMYTPLHRIDICFAFPCVSNECKLGVRCTSPLFLSM